MCLYKAAQNGLAFWYIVYRDCYRACFPIFSKRSMQPPIRVPICVPHPYLGAAIPATVYVLQAAAETMRCFRTLRCPRQMNPASGTSVVAGPRCDKFRGPLKNHLAVRHNSCSRTLRMPRPCSRNGAADKPRCQHCGKKLNGLNCGRRV